ncbi:MAG: hypothetical protein N2440_06640 [Actinobacteria bacterium]|nr:hypothetical protein [Actinomycetota bacterium]
MSNKSQIAYTQYIKIALDRVRELKEEGHDVSEANRILQSIVAAVIESDFNCADFLINELESVFAKIESYRSPDFPKKKPGFPQVETRYMPVARSDSHMEPFRFVVKDIKRVEPVETRSKLIITFIYVFLFLFIFTLISLIYYLLRFRG